MQKNPVDYALYAILDREWLDGRDIAVLAEEALSGGASILQYRNKVDETGDFYRQALRIRKVTEDFGVPFLINDRMDIALAVGADGVHVGQSDLPVHVIRKWLGRDRIIGISVSRPEELSSIAGADYLGVGSVYPTGSKAGVQVGGLDLIRSVRAETDLPIVGIGGIQIERVAEVIGAGCDGVAVISALFGQADVRGAALKISKAVEEARGGSTC
ncbi:MAG TPA: thiamine phosphate synthase [bacterium]|nr:thiamine phosphate synthase [bacterium]